MESERKGDVGNCWWDVGGCCQASGGGLTCIVFSVDSWMPAPEFCNVLLCLMYMHHAIAMRVDLCSNDLDCVRRVVRRNISPPASR